MTTKMKKAQARLRLVASSGELVELRRYAQSKSGHSDSQVTLPLDSCSIRTARDSAQEREPYATLRKCPVVVLHRAAKSSRSATDMLFQNSSRSMPNYHHAVIEKATPNGEFTVRCHGGDNADMEKTAGIRRRNLQKLIDRDFAGNKSEIARAYAPENPKPQYFSDVLRHGSGKSFGEKVARQIEERLGLLPGQLDQPDSDLLYDERRRNRIKDEIRLALDDLDRDEQRELLSAIHQIRGRRITPRRKAAG